MARHKKRIVAECVYCGTVTKLTEDHVIPRCWYVEKQPPSDIPRVYACPACNNTKKNLDDSFLRDILVMDMRSFDHPMAQNIFNDTFLRAALNPNRVQSPLARRVQHGDGRRVPVYSPGGIYLYDGFAIEMDKGRIRRIFGTIVRGLCLYYTGLSLPPNVECIPRRLLEPNAIENITAMMRNLGAAHRMAGDGQVFQCLYAVARERPDVSFWVLAFYQRYFVVVETRAPEADAS